MCVILQLQGVVTKNTCSHVQILTAIVPQAYNQLMG